MSRSGNLRQRFVRSAYYRFGVDVEFLVDIGDLAGGAKTLHADEPAFEADVAYLNESQAFSMMRDILDG
jgi:hypothetical protein